MFASLGPAAEAISAGRAARGAAVTRPYLALHDGEVLYGNFGAPTRLDFTVLGPAVNEAARLAALSHSLDQPLIVSDRLRRYLRPRPRPAGGPWPLRTLRRRPPADAMDAGP